jgi:hypothetical protein
MLVKTDSVGIELWTKTYGGSGYEEAWSVIEHSINNELVFAGRTLSFGAGSWDLMLVVQTSDGSGTAGANAIPTEGTQLLTEADQTITQATQTLTEGVVTLVDADQTVTTTVVFAITPSQSPSTTKSVSRTRTPSTTKSVTKTRTPSTSQTPSQTSSQTASQTASRTPSKSSGASSTSSQTPSQSSSQTPSQTATSVASASASPSGTSAASQTASASISPSGTSAASASASSTSAASRTASQTSSVTPSASASASANVNDPCDDHLCASGAGCVVVSDANQYTCDCTAISTAAVRVVGRHCNTTVEGKPVSVGGNNCPGCESAFVCTDSYSGDDPDKFMESVIPLLAGVACGCGNPPQALLDMFGAVQHQVQDDGSLCMEFTIYSGNPNITAADIVQELEDTPPDTFTVQTNRIADFEPCDDEVDGCNSGGSGGDDSLLFIIIGVAAFCFLLLLGIVWYCLHKRVGQQFMLQNEATTAANEVVVHKVQADMADAGDSKSIDNEITPAPAKQDRLPTVLPDLDDLNDIHVPATSAPGFVTKISPSGARITVMHHKPIVLENFDEEEV